MSVEFIFSLPESYWRLSPQKKLVTKMTTIKNQRAGKQNRPCLVARYQWEGRGHVERGLEGESRGNILYTSV
jgi:hypothetical protein